MENTFSFKSTSSKIGRPTVMSDAIKDLLVYAFSLGCNDEEACVFANICPSTLYNYQKKDQEFLDYKKMLKLQPILKARMAIYSALSDPEFAWKYLCKKAPDFS